MLHGEQIKQSIFLFNSILMEGKMKTGVLTKLHKDSQGFTLIELMIVVAIIGILAAVAIPQYQNFTKKSKASEAKVILDAITTAEASYFAEKDNMTAALGDLGNPESPAKYYTYAAAGTGDLTTITATPNTTGTGAGLSSTWTMTYNGTSGNKTTTFPSKGF